MTASTYLVTHWRRAVDFAAREARLNDKELIRCLRLADVAMAVTGELRSAGEHGTPYSYRQLSDVMNVSPDTGRGFLGRLQGLGLLHVEQSKEGEAKPDRRWLRVPDGWSAPPGYQFVKPMHYRRARGLVHGVHRPQADRLVHGEPPAVHRFHEPDALEKGKPAHYSQTGGQRVSVGAVPSVGTVGVLPHHPVLLLDASSSLNAAQEGDSSREDREVLLESDDGLATGNDVGDSNALDWTSATDLPPAACPQCGESAVENWHRESHNVARHDIVERLARGQSLERRKHEVRCLSCGFQHHYYEEIAP